MAALAIQNAPTGNPALTLAGQLQRAYTAAALASQRYLRALAVHEAAAEKLDALERATGQLNAIQAKAHEVIQMTTPTLTPHVCAKAHGRLASCHDCGRLLVPIDGADIRAAAGFRCPATPRNPLPSLPIGAAFECGGVK